MTILKQLEDLDCSIRAKKLLFLEEQKKDKLAKNTLSEELILSRLSSYGVSIDAAKGKPLAEVFSVLKSFSLILEAANWLACSYNKGKALSEVWEKAPAPLSLSEKLMLEDMAPLIVLYDQKFTISRKLYKKIQRELKVKGLLKLPLNLQLYQMYSNTIHFKIEKEDFLSNNIDRMIEIMSLANIGIVKLSLKVDNDTLNLNFRYTKVGAGILTVMGTQKPDHPLYKKRYFMINGFLKTIFDDALADIKRKRAPRD